MSFSVLSISDHPSEEAVGDSLLLALVSKLDADSDGSVSPAEIDAFSDAEWAEMARIEEKLNDFVKRIRRESKDEL